jgi:protein-L-isoaspartate(D-aspartate) O-methyltransferase
MTDFALARRMMVEGQVRTNDVTDPRIIAAMMELPRERFLPPAMMPLAYLDLDIPMLEDAQQRRTRRMLKPMLLAKLIQAAEVEEGDAVLDVGCTTGYSSALLSHIGATVTALEEEPALAQQAKETLSALGFTKVSVVTGALSAGYAPSAPYDVIVLEGATEVEPRMLFPHLADGGRLVCVQGRAPATKAVIYRRTGNDVSGRAAFDASASVLPQFEEKPAFVF